MADPHPSRQELELYLDGQLPDPQARMILEHLLSDCPDCRQITGERWSRVLQGLRAARQEIPSISAEAAQETASPYGRAFERAIGAAAAEARFRERSWPIAYRLLEELESHPPRRRLTMVRNFRRFRNPELCQILIDRGFDQRFTDTQAGVELTELAVAVAEQLDDEICSKAEKHGLLGRAWAFHGNALRVVSELRLAETALRRSRESLEQSQTTDLDHALWCRFSALVSRAHRDFAAADHLQNQAVRLYLRHGESRIASQVMSDQGLGLLYQGKPEAAMTRLEQALALLGTMGSEREVTTIRYNLAFCLSENGEHERALALVAGVRSSLQDAGDFLSLVRLRWLEGRILFALGRDWPAEEAFLEARDAFIEESIGYDTALVCLDLALLYARQGRTGEIRLLAERMLPIFQSRDVHREAIAALILFRDAAVAETATLALVEQIGRYLQRARHDPDLRFEVS